MITPVIKAVKPIATVLGNLKSALRSTYHSLKPKYAQRYLAKFQYRFNRRFKLQELIPRLTYVALRTPPIPEKPLKIGLAQMVIRKLLSIDFDDNLHRAYTKNCI